MSESTRDFETTFYARWRTVFDSCYRWSQQHKHRHRIRQLETGAWRVTCLVVEP